MRLITRIVFAILLALGVASAQAATCKISEYRTMAKGPRGSEINVALEPPITTQTVTYSTSAQSSAFNDATHFIRVICDAKAHFVISAAGTNATADDPYVPADTAEYFGVNAGADLIIDFYDGSS